MSIENLRAHWALTRMPFSKDLDPSMFHPHRSHTQGVARITWCIEEQVMGVVTGEVGAGKSVALRAALFGLDVSRYSVIYLGNPTVGVRGLYASIVSALGGTPRFHRAQLVPQAAEALANEEHERGRQVVLVLDEAHLLDSDQLEAVRLLSTADIDSHAPFACLLVGQPTLRRRINLASFAALSQRVALRYSMAGMDRDETAHYIAHHLAIAGLTETVFSEDATGLIHQVSRGLPRAVNNLAVQSLVAAFVEDKSIVDESSARSAVTEMSAE